MSLHQCRRLASTRRPEADSPRPTASQTSRKVCQVVGPTVRQLDCGMKLVKGVPHARTHLTLIFSFSRLHDQNPRHRGLRDRVRRRRVPVRSAHARRQQPPEPQMARVHVSSRDAHRPRNGEVGVDSLREPVDPDA